MFIRSHRIFNQKTSFYMAKIDPTSDGAPSISLLTKGLPWYRIDFFQEKIREVTHEKISQCWVMLENSVLRTNSELKKMDHCRNQKTHGIRTFQGPDQKCSSGNRHFCQFYSNKIGRDEGKRFQVWKIKVKGSIRSWLLKQTTKIHSFFHKIGLSDGDQAEFWTKITIFNHSNAWYIRVKPRC